MNVGIICGSINSDSLNKKLAHALIEQAPPEVTTSIIEIDHLPLYNKDLDRSLPESVQAFKEAVRAADAILFVTPEHNRSVSAALKNAIDWGSRPNSDTVWDKKPGVTTGATTGSIGTAVGQYHLKQIMMHIGMRILSNPEFHLGHAPEKFDAEGNLTDDGTRERIVTLWAAFVEHITRFQ